jgi:1-acyl-sn-glycerol-3-phosphate acyltransferase
MIGHRFTRALINLIVRLSTRLEAEGRELLPESGAYAIASNHLGRLDAIFVYYFLARSDIIMLVAEKYRKIPIIPWLVKQLDAIWVDRFNADIGALRESLRRLKKGWVLVLAPEGTRSKTGALIEGRPGVSYLAAKAGVPIYPVAITGTEDKNVLAHLRRLRRPRVFIRVGQPFDLPPLKGQDREAVLQANTDEIMCRIAALLPPGYRGVYADHPRTQELLAQ